MPENFLSSFIPIGGIMVRMTEEEAKALDEYYTKNPPKVDPSKRGGRFIRQRDLLEALDKVSADYIMTRAMTDNKMPVQIIGEMVRERIELQAAQ
jgi:hypothetical protein